MTPARLLHAALYKSAFIPLFDSQALALQGGLAGGIGGAGLALLGNRLLRRPETRNRELVSDLAVGGLAGGGLGAVAGGAVGRHSMNQAQQHWNELLAKKEIQTLIGQRAAAGLGPLEALRFLSRMRDPSAAVGRFTVEAPGIISDEHKAYRMNPFESSAVNTGNLQKVHNKILDRLAETIVTP